MTFAKSYYRIRLGEESIHAEKCREGGFIGVDWLVDIDLSGKLPDGCDEFKQKFIPVYLKKHPRKSKPAAEYACRMLHTVCRGIRSGAVVLCPNGAGAYYVGEVVSDYQYMRDAPLPHRREVHWHSGLIDRKDMSSALYGSAKSRPTSVEVTKYAEEIEGLLAGNAPLHLAATDELVEDRAVFALEKHLEDFLVHNWSSTPLGKDYDVLEDDGELIGQQYPSDTGPIDILAIRKDKKELLVVELKKGRASDRVVGQIQRYMGYVMDDLAEPGQSVRGIIIAMEDDLRIRHALRAAQNIDFYRYEVSFSLKKV